jgi:Protein of unknown function (DUF3108)
MFASVLKMPRRRASWRGLLLIALVVVSLHALLLRHARFAAPGHDARGTAPAALQVRAWVPAPQVVVPEPASQGDVPEPAPQARVFEPAVQAFPAQGRPPLRRSKPPSVLTPDPTAVPARASPDGLGEAVEPAPREVAANPLSDAPATAVLGGVPRAEPIPTYATTIPAPFTQVYELRRGALVGHAELHWRPSGDAYEAQLTASLGDTRWLEWVSRGGFDAAGLAPLRFTDQRRGRAAQAANFRRVSAGEGATISYSGPSVRHPLPAGAQDRLSWIVQLSAILQARSSAPRPGESVVVFVSGARGDADAWVFTVVGAEQVDGTQGAVDALKLVREPRRPYDTHAEIWLDPARAHLPARMRFTSPPRGDGLEFVLRDVSMARP